MRQDAHGECHTCCSACSGSDRGVETWADEHEKKYPDHHVTIEYEGWD